MNDIAIIDAVLDQLRTGMKRLTNPILTRENSGFEPAGSPPPNAPTLYISVDENGVTNPAAPQQDHLKERHRITVYINRRTGGVAPDRYSSIYRKLNSGLTAIERKIIAAIHGNWEILTRANELLGELVEDGEAGQPFSSALWYTGRPKTKPRGAEWSGETTSDGRKPIGWIVRELEFVGFDRVTPNESIT